MTAQLDMTSGTCMMDTYNILIKRQVLVRDTANDIRER